MVNFTSPGNYVIEKDFSDYIPANNSSIVGILGFAARGPENTATLITSQAQLFKVFGRPDQVLGGQGLLGASETLSHSNTVYYVRAATTSSLDASAGVSYGMQPAAYVSGLLNTSAYSFRADVYGSNGVRVTTTPIEVSIASQTNPASSIASSLDQQAGGNFGLTFHTDTTDTSSQGWFVGSYAGSAAYISVSAFSGTTAYTSNAPILWGTDGSHVASGAAGAASVTTSGSTAIPANVSGGTYNVRSLYTGSGYNFASAVVNGLVQNKGLSVEVESRTGKDNVLVVNVDGGETESYAMDFVDDGAGGGAFPENVVNTGLDNATSEYVKGEFLVDGGTDRNWAALTAWGTAGTTQMAFGRGGGTITGSPKFLKLVDGTYNLAGGKNGDGTDVAGDMSHSGIVAAFIGNEAQKTGMYGLDDDSLNISIGIIPGISIQSIQNAFTTLAENSQNFINAQAPPLGLNSTQGAVNWHNGKGNGRTAAINSSYTAIYWSWLKQFDVFTRSDIWLDPAVAGVNAMVDTDGVNDPWFAPAGLTRGRLTKPTDVEVKLNQGDMNVLYGGGNAINPIAKFAQDGIVIWGQRTAQRTPTALDRINVRRMMIHVRKALLAGTRRFTFEPNDSITWSRVENRINPMMEDIRRRRGITEFRVICDETTNTPVRVARNEMWCRILIKPTPTAEILIFEVNITGQSADLGSV